MWSLINENVLSSPSGADNKVFIDLIHPSIAQLYKKIQFKLSVQLVNTTCAGNIQRIKPFFSCSPEY